jgi:hypothetical protein
VLGARGVCLRSDRALVRGTAPAAAKTRLRKAANFGRPAPGLALLGNYFGSTTGPSDGGGQTDYTASVTTYDDGTNPANRQQLVSAAAVP